MVDLKVFWGNHLDLLQVYKGIKHHMGLQRRMKPRKKCKARWKLVFSGGVYEVCVRKSPKLQPRDIRKQLIHAVIEDARVS